MATIEPYETKAGRRWRVRYRKPDRRQTDKRGFKTKRDAAAFAATVEVDKATGSYVEPRAGRVTIAELGEAWKTRRGHLKPSSRRRGEVAYQNQVLPHFGDWPVSAVTRADVQAWVSRLSEERSASTVRIAHSVLRQILDDAVDGRRVKDNAAAGVKLPRKASRRKVFLTHQDVAALAEASARPDVVYVLAYCGLRWGEMAGLRWGDLAGGRLSVERSLSRVGPHLVEGPVKSYAARTVPVPAFLAERLEAVRGGDDDLMFHAGGRPLQSQTATARDGWMTVACRRAGLARVTPHDLRHTCASLAVQAGAHAKSLQRMLGHASAAITLDTYAALFESDLDAVAVALDAARAGAAG